MSGLFKVERNLASRCCLFLLFLSILLILLDQRYSLVFMRFFLEKKVFPIVQIVDQSVQWCLKFRYQLSNQQQLAKENLHLKETQAVLSARMQHCLILKRENQSLHRLLNSTSFLRQEEITLARPLAINAGTEGRHELILKNIQRDRRIQPRQIVLNAQGVMGQVIAVGPLLSRVMLITDKRSEVPVEIKRNRKRGILAGQGAHHLLKLTHFPKLGDIEVGDILLSSGLGGGYPSGYPVAKITQVHHNPEVPFLEITATPQATFLDYQPVLVLEHADSLVPKEN